MQDLKRASFVSRSRSHLGSMESDNSFEDEYERMFKTLVNRSGTDLAETEKLKQTKRKEKKILAKDLGIDLALENSRYSHFLDQAVHVVLPVGWKLEYTPQGRIYYYNEIEGKYSDSHPCLPFFKKLMSHRYKKFLKGFGRKIAQGSTDRHTDQGRPR